MNLYGYCAPQAQTQGALAVVDGYCVEVSGKVIPIGPTEADVERGFEITNFNFHVNGSQPAVLAPGYAPGPTKGAESTTKPTNRGPSTGASI